MQPYLGLTLWFCLPLISWIHAEPPNPVRSAKALPLQSSPTRGRFLAHRRFVRGRFRPTCQKCHATQPNPTDRRRLSGPPLYNSWYRNQFKNGRFDTPEEAVLDCMQRYQGLDSKAEALHIAAWLEGLSRPQAQEPFPYTEADPKQAWPVLFEGSLDSLSGKILYDLSCATCHNGLNASRPDRWIQSRRSMYSLIRGLKTHKAQNPQTVHVYTGEHPVFNPAMLRDEELSDIFEYILNPRGVR